jgi:hypothetical protein
MRMQDVVQSAILTLLNLPEDMQESAARAILDYADEAEGAWD